MLNKIEITILILVIILTIPALIHLSLFSSCDSWYWQTQPIKNIPARCIDNFLK